MLASHTNETETDAHIQSSADDSLSLWTPANVVTCTRICLIPLLIVLMLVPWASGDVRAWTTAILFAVISLTDSLDGYLARSRNQITTFGKFMDPIADKLLVISVMVAMVDLGTLPAWIPIVIVAREFLVSGLRMVAASAGTVIAASKIGKAKTLFTMIALFMFMVMDSSVFNALHVQVIVFSWALMIIAVVLTIVSMVDYFAKGASMLFDTPSRKRSRAKDAHPAHHEDQGTAPAAGMTEPASSLSAAFQEDPHKTDGAQPTKDAVADKASVSDETFALAEKVITSASRKHLRIGTAESLTGGLICATLTEVPGASDVVAGGVASYMVDIKESLLGVPEQTIDNDGVVSEQTATKMAEGALSRLGLNVAVAVTGVAGPGGGTPETPVGTVCFCVADSYGRSKSITERFPGSREDVRQATVRRALALLFDGISAMSDSCHEID